MSDEKITLNCGGCVTLIIEVLILWALWFGLPTPWGRLNIDIFPPQIWNMEKGR